LVTVGEVVVTGAHVVEGSLFSRLNNTGIEIGGLGVDLGTVSWVAFDGSLVLGVLEFIQRKAVGLSQVRQLLDGFEVGLPILLNEHGVLLQLGVIHWEQFAARSDFTKVVTIRTGIIIGVAVVRSSFSVVWPSLRVVVRTDPLNVEAVPLVDLQVIWDEVILNRRIDLDDVSSLSSGVEVVDSTIALGLGLGNNSESV
jgi:hypothetical protein